ncbi:MAG: PD-(D/E)XK nuclease family protein [Brumimicrobium sp.]|nr:PD-(D/E)XK nuclease family protein [Brumimicrobium sp.]
MIPFIEKIANYIYENDLPLEHLQIILPSQRAKKYLQRALYRRYNKPIFSPHILTMNSWVHQLSPQPIIDSTRAVFKLYHIHLEIEKKEPQSIDEFLKWANILLSDFDEIDRYLINNIDLFKNLQDIKEIENWSFDSTNELSEGQKRFMQFWDLLKDYYKLFNEQLERDNETYMGKAYKHLSNHLETVFKEDKEAYFIFAGFNALSPAELSIIKQLHKMGRAKVFVDGDSYYINNTTHEAGYFLRNLIKKIDTPNLPFIENQIAEGTKKIKLYNCVQATGQAKVSASILYNQIPANEFSDTLLLLADEKLIVPVIKNIPQNVGVTNITLGLPLKNTALKSWTELLFKVQEHFTQFKNKQIYHKDFIRFIKHPFVIAFCSDEEKEQLSRVEATLLSKNWIFIFAKNLEISTRLRKLIELFFTPWTLPIKTLPLEIDQLNQFIFSGLDKDKFKLERAIIYHFSQAIQQLTSILDEFRMTLHLGTFKLLFNQHWINESVAYYGNPLEGLQVMGLLETRLLDFKNVLIVGLNEGNLPPTNLLQTLIPMDLRKFHGLPTPKEKQGLFAHHFYRLLHQAQNIWITYSSADRDLGGIDEPSRYILQLELELAKKAPNITIQKYDYIVGDSEKNNSQIAVEKTAPVLARLDEYFIHKTSASALKTALTCSLDFYYKYLIGMGEEKIVEEDMESNTFGSFVHSTLEELYGKFAQFNKKGESLSPRKLTELDYEDFINRQKDILSNKFNKFFNISNNQYVEGKNYLSLEMASYLMEQLLIKERKEFKNEGGLIINSVERELKKTLHLSINGVIKEINFIGILDRIDEVKGLKRIIDYKTGKCERNDVIISGKSKQFETDDDKVQYMLDQLKTRKYVFQLLVYNMLFYQEFGYYPDRVGIVSLVNLKESPFYLINDFTDTFEELMELFEKALTLLITNLYDTNIPFVHDDKALYCGYC